MTREEINQKAINAYPEKHGPMSSQEYRILDDKRAAYIRGWEDAEAHKKSDWISVEDRLPEVIKPVIVLSDMGDIHNTFLLKNKQGKLMWDSDGLLGTPVYWMPIPELRKED